jgi:hypothetical protein
MWKRTFIEMKNLQMSLFNNDGVLVSVQKIDNCDCVKSHSIFYLTNPRTNNSGVDSPITYNEASVIRISKTLHSVELINGKIILRYDLGYCEIVCY